MADVIVNAQRREGKGKGPARRLRQQGLIPAVVYGRKQEPTHLAVDPSGAPQGDRDPSQVQHPPHPEAGRRREARPLQGLGGRSRLAQARARRLPRGEPRGAGEGRRPGRHDGPLPRPGRGRHPLARDARDRARGAAGEDPGADRGRHHEPQDRPVDPRLAADAARGLQVQVLVGLRRRVPRRAREGGGRRSGGCRVAGATPAEGAAPAAAGAPAAGAAARRCWRRGGEEGPRGEGRRRSRRALEARRRPWEPRPRVRAHAPQRRLSRCRPARARPPGRVHRRGSSPPSSRRAGPAASGSGS